MKRLLSVFLLLTVLMALFCQAFAVVECQVPQELPGIKTDVAVHDVQIIGGTPEENTAPDAPVQDVPADGMGLGGMIDGKYATIGNEYRKRTEVVKVMVYRRNTERAHRGNNH